MEQLKLSDFDEVENLLNQKLVDYDAVKQKLHELNRKLMNYSVFRNYLLTRNI